MNWTWFETLLKRPPIGLWDLADILVVSILIYELLKLIRGTRAVQMAVGGGLLAILFYGSRSWHLETLNWLVRNMFGYVVFGIIVLFQSDIRRALAHFGRVDVLMNVAGYLKPGFVHQLDAAEVDKHLDINTKGLIHGCRVIGRHFAAQKSGHIVNIGSLASLAPVAGLNLYVASKYAVRGFTLAIAQELAPHHVHVSLVMPDAVQTPMLDLQVDYAEAAMTFSGPRALTVQDIERVLIEEVLPNRPLEVTIPMTRGLIARFATFMPGTAMSLGPTFNSQGRKKQEALKALRAPKE